ncbi:transmembrane and coiled-coil domain-containing protein 3 isoform X2 [Narcine bancroftii]|uniref:transmembrane and coiled-coil domain-containing protein 3 isoform X2 n=1 Tax=Narcine bancroftii TaxID=1343680 RepID=UPI003831AE02
MKRIKCGVVWIVFALAYCGSVQTAEHVEMAKHIIKLHRGRGAAITKGILWIMDNCKRLSGMLQQKNIVLNKLKKAIEAVEKNTRLSVEEKIFQIHTFETFQKELNESEKSVFQAVHGLERVLQGDYKDVVNMKESSKQRLEALREAAIKEEKEYIELLAAEKHQAEALKNIQHANKSLSILDGILEDVRKAADRLEEEIDDHVFDKNKLIHGNFEAVIRVEEDEEDHKQNTSMHQVQDSLGLSMLIDSQNNQYILTKPRDSTISRADIHFIKDIISIVVLSLPCGWICTMMGLPTMFGYIICGVLLGPSGLNYIKSIVQVETLGEFGVFFTLFVVGLEFSPDRLRKVWKISLQGTSYMAFLMIAFGLLWGHLLNIRPTQSIFISTCLSLSSTPLVSKFLALGAKGEKDGDADYSSVLLGMLVMQDVQLSLFIAVMPMLIQAGSSTANRKLQTEGRGNREILVLGISTFIFLMLMVTESLDVSMELGCFLAGALISSQGYNATEEVMLCMEPIRDFLAIIFFASVGLHVFPTFVLYELTVLMCLTLAVVISKFILAVLVLSLILPRNSRYIRWIVSAGLAQVSEFSFVLSSRARKSGIVSREVYLLILSVTTLSLLLAPALWKGAILKCAPKPDRRSTT